MSSKPHSPISPESTVLPIILAVTLGHLLNDLMQSLIPAAYPLLKQNLSLKIGRAHV